jgi:hypothetical protein
MLACSACPAKPSSGPVVAYSPGLAAEFAFILEIEGIAPVAAA